MARWLCLALVLLLGNGCDPGRRGISRDSGVSAIDADGDGISDDDEGRSTRRDSDGDGTPDFEDDDSDGDFIPDNVEAGDFDPLTAPLDSDSDGTPDFIDEDSDGNGIPDGWENEQDLDEDGIPNFRDLDDDDDYINDLNEIRGMIGEPPDFDGDGQPDHQDPDSDNDTILDGHERDLDTDRDGVPDANDRDSDNDGVLDSIEAGDRDLRTAPIDSDGDFIPNFRETDSDNDGLSDADEALAGSSSTTGDTDGDGVSDLIEAGAGTDPTDDTDNPRTRGDFVFIVPYNEPPDPTMDTLQFRTNIQFADIYFLFDRSGSMATEIGTLRTRVTSIMANLTCQDFGTPCMRDTGCTTAGQVCSSFTHTCIEDPATSSCIPSPWTGGGYYEASYTNRTSLQSSASTTSTGLNFATSGSVERLFGAVWGVANPSASPITESGCAAAMTGRIGCPAFRSEAVRILVAFTDEALNGGTETAAQAGAALRTAGITFIGVNSGSTASGDSLLALANESGSFDRLGNPMVYTGIDAGVETAVTTAINEIVEGIPLRVTIGSADEPGDAGDALQFIQMLRTNTTSTGCSNLTTEDSNPADGVHDTFPSVTPGLPVCWDVVPRMNTTVMPAASPLVFKARLTIYSGGSPLDSRLVYFLIPPVSPEPGLD